MEGNQSESDNSGEDGHNVSLVWTGRVWLGHASRVSRRFAHNAGRNFSTASLTWVGDVVGSHELVHKFEQSSCASNTENLNNHAVHRFVLHEVYIKFATGLAGLGSRHACACLAAKPFRPSAEREREDEMAIRVI